MLWAVEHSLGCVGGQRVMLWAVERSEGLCREPAWAAERDLGVGSSQGSCPRLLGRLSAAEEGEQSSSWGPCQRSPQRLAELCRRRRVSRSDLINGTEHGRLSAA